MYDVLIVGCGVVGASVAYELSKYKLKLGIVEAENDVCTGTSRANSAIIHAGYDPLPGTLMARLNVRGNALCGELCQKLCVPFKRIGSLVLAFDEADMEHIKALYDRGNANGVPDLRLLTSSQVRELEPKVSQNVLGALHAPSAGVIDPMGLTVALAEIAVENGAELHLSSRVCKIEKLEDRFCVTTSSGRRFESRYIINAAGVYADEVHGLISPCSFSISPSRGQYYLLDKSQGDTVHSVVFQCPTAAGKGVLVSPTIHGNLIVGPDSQCVEEKDDRSTTAAGLAYVAQASRKSVPDIVFRDNIRNFAGLRAISDHDDFIIGESPDQSGFFDLAGIKSPGLSAAPAMGEYMAELLSKAGLALEKKDSFVDERKTHTFKLLSPEEKGELIKNDPRYGRVICRCETVTEGEIVSVLHSSIPPCSIAGVKRRLGAGMGRCQGGFCSPRVCEIIARELGISPLDVPEDLEGSFILTGKTKGEEAAENV